MKSGLVLGMALGAGIVVAVSSAKTKRIMSSAYETLSEKFGKSRNGRAEKNCSCNEIEC